MATYDEWLKSQGIADDSLYNNGIQDSLKTSYTNLGGDSMEIAPIENGLMNNLGDNISAGLGTIKNYAGPIKDIAGGIGAYLGYREDKKNNKVNRAVALQNLDNAKYNRANKEAFDKIWNNPGLGKINA